VIAFCFTGATVHITMECPPPTAKGGCTTWDPSPLPLPILPWNRVAFTFVAALIDVCKGGLGRLAARWAGWSAGQVGRHVNIEGGSGTEEAA